MSYQVLDDNQIAQFVNRGFLCLKGAIPPDFVETITDKIWVRLGYDPQDPSTWSEDYFGMPPQRSWRPDVVAPLVWGAYCDLAGGADRIVMRPWSDGFVVNFGERADAAWEPPSPRQPGWHYDGDNFRHYLDSPELALLTICLYSDVRSKGGPTVLLPESVGVVARYMADHTGGLLIEDVDFAALAAQCTEVVEATGEPGDVYLVHPLMLHAQSQNVLRVARFMTNPALRLREPMCFDREDAADYSPIERAILAGLGVDRLDFRPGGPREYIRDLPARRRAQVRAERKRMEDVRLRAASLTAVNFPSSYQ